jgi:hypothetical protein
MALGNLIGVEGGFPQLAGIHLAESAAGKGILPAAFTSPARCAA